MRHIPAIDGLRALAVLAVVAFHAGLPVPAGFVGVDVFFVISGYVITRMLAAEERIDFLAFYARRARRILPALAALILAVLIASAFLLPPSGEQQRVAQSAAASLLFSGNLFFLSTTGGYFDPNTDTMPLLHLWSLGVEEQFYLLWPLLLVAARKRLVWLAVGSFVLAEVWLWLTPDAAFYQMPARFWELAAGGLIALSTPRAIKWALPIGLPLTLAACFLPLPHFPGAGALPAVVGASLVVLAVHGGARSRLLESRPMVAVGLISYSLYLWHWPLLAFARSMRAGPLPLWLSLALVAAAFVLAWASYRYIETHFRRSQASARRAVAVGVAASLVLALCAFSYGRRPVEMSPLVRASLLASQDRPNMACHEQDRMEPNAPRCRAKVIVWGDSMALAWLPFAQAIGPAANMSRDSCGPSGMGRSPRASVRCAEFNRQAMAYVKSGEVETLVLAWRWSAGAEYTAGLENVVREARPHVRRIIVIGPSPTLLAPAPECIAHEKDCSVPRAEFEAWASPVRARLAGLGVEFADPSDALCDAARCPVTRNGRALYWDAYHVSSSAARAFASDWLTQSSRRIPLRASTTTTTD